MKKNYITPQMKSRQLDSLNVLQNSGNNGYVNVTNPDNTSSSVVGDGVEFGGKDDAGIDADAKKVTIWDEEEE